MKIKTTKTMNLPQLIEHIVETSYECNKYIADNAKSSVYVGSIKGVVVEGTIFPTDTFTVEVEEEITKDTVFPSLAVVRKQHFASGNSTIHVTKINNKSINALIGKQPNNSTFEYKEVYLMDNDKLGQCIWRDGKLVE